MLVVESNLLHKSRKKIVLLTCSLLFLTQFPSLSAQAEQLPTLVIADTAVDSSLSEFSGNIVQEVCILDYFACPNGSDFMEGKGSAYLPKELIQFNGFNHGTQMVSAAVRTNPDLRVVFIRIISHSSNGTRLPASIDVIKRTLDWVQKNKITYNIQAVAISQGHHNLLSLTNYCPQDGSFNLLIDDLYEREVPYFAPAGNKSDRSRIDWPACVSNVIAVGALTPQKEVASYTNIDKERIDYYEIGRMKVLDANNQDITTQGTSISAQVAAAKWIRLKSLYPTMTISESLTRLRLEGVYDYKKETSSKIAESSVIYPTQFTDEYKGVFQALRDLISQLQNLLRKALKK